jgi:hypothetical protein
LNSRGDIRLLPGPKSGSIGVPPTVLETEQDLTLVAAQIYPATGTQAVIVAGGPTTTSQGINPDAVLTIERSTDADPALPFSVFGSLIVLAPTIEQGGILRAPLGSIQLGMNGTSSSNLPLSGEDDTQRLDLLPGSITSTSAAGLVMPYGGTSDGINYLYNGTTVSLLSAGLFSNSSNLADVARGVLFGSRSVDMQPGAVVDVSGGGDLTGAGFVTGRGGSVDILKTPFTNADPTFPVSTAGDKVYALVPSFTGSYAAVNTENGAGDPTLGQQITIPSGVPGLPAGTYTLLPSNYALLPGAFRIEIAGVNAHFGAPQQLADGSYVGVGYLGISNTGVKAALPNEIILSPGTVTRSHAQYNETSYSDFALAQAAQFGTILAYLPRDAGELWFTYSNQLSNNPLTVDGSILTAPADDGRGAVVAVTDPSASIEITADGATPTSGWLSLRASDLDALNAAAFEIGGTHNSNFAVSSTLDFQGASGPVAVRTGADLTAAQIILLGADIMVESGATLDTSGRGAAAFDSSAGIYFSNVNSLNRPTGLLALSNGQMNFLAPQGGRHG